jgi:hypothetical protein
VVAAALAAYAIVEAGQLAPLVDVLAGLGLFCTVAALTLRGRLTAGALFALAAAYAVVDASGDVASSSVIGYAVGLILLAELLAWPQEIPAAALADPAAMATRVVLLGALTATSALLALVVLTAASMQLPGAFEAALLGGAAAVLLLTLPWLLMHSDTHGSEARSSG